MEYGIDDAIEVRNDEIDRHYENRLHTYPTNTSLNI